MDRYYNYKNIYHNILDNSLFIGGSSDNSTIFDQQIQGILNHPETHNLDLRNRETVNLIMSTIDNYLKTIDVCFLRGVYMFELGMNLFSKILVQLWSNGSVRALQETHKNFTSTDINKLERLCEDIPPCSTADYKIYTPPKPQREVIFNYDQKCDQCVNDTCTDSVEKSAKKEVILLYPFLFTSGGRTRLYLFFKA